MLILWYVVCTLPPEVPLPKDICQLQHYQNTLVQVSALTKAWLSIASLEVPSRSVRNGSRRTTLICTIRYILKVDLSPPW
jgi:hypothetical protein